jgi:methionyl aminopeptidase
MTIDNDDDLKHLKSIGRIVFETMLLMKKSLKPGISTAQLDRIGEKNLARYGARSAPILMYDFPGHTCISINDEAAHGIPSGRKVEPGDVVNIDVSAELNGYFGDTGATFTVPPVDPRIEYLCQVTRKSLNAAINAGFATIRDLGSHGIGRSLHEEPHFIQNFYDKSDTRILSEGQVITIEPFLSTVADSTVTAADGWALLTGDGNRSAQYEHTMVITRGKPLVLTAL